MVENAFLTKVTIQSAAIMPKLPHCLSLFLWLLYLLDRYGNDINRFTFGKNAHTLISIVTNLSAVFAGLL